MSEGEVELPLWLFLLPPALPHFSRFSPFSSVYRTACTLLVDFPHFGTLKTVLNSRGSARAILTLIMSG